MIGFFLRVDPIMWRLGTHKQKSNLVAGLNHKLLCEKAADNVQMVLSLQSGLQSIHQRIPELMASGKSQRKPENFYELNSNTKKKKKKESIVQKILIVFHVEQAFLRETSQYQRSSLLHCSGFWSHNQGAEEVQERALPSACRRTIVSLRPRTQFHRRKR